MKTDQPHIAIVDDCSLTRFSLRTLISLTPSYTVMVEASNGEELIKYLEKAFTLPDICLLDIGMPIMNGYETLPLLKKRWPSIKVLVVSQFCREYSINYMILKGCNGIVSKDGVTSKLSEAINAIMQNGYYYSDIAPKELYDKIRNHNIKVHQIAAQEKKVLTFICKGLTNKEMAEKIGIEKRTVDAYRDNICLKLNAKTRSALSEIAITNELII